MSKTVLITGSTDGIGLVTAKTLAELGHTILLHGRSEKKLIDAKKQLLLVTTESKIETFSADLSVLSEVKTLASAIAGREKPLDVLINNAGVFIVPETSSVDGLDIRFVVNTIAPYMLTKQLAPTLGKAGRVINLSSAAQAPVQPEELVRPSLLDDGTVYAKSKLAITMWSKHLADQLKNTGPVIIAVNPASFLGSKMVMQAYGKKGGDLQRGADILTALSLNESFDNATGLYFDNDIGKFTSPHPDATNKDKNRKLAESVEQLLAIQS